MKKIGSIGMGNMGGSIVRGAVHSGAFTPEQVGIYDIKAETCAQCTKEGFTIFNDEAAAYEGVEMLLLAVKPQGCIALMEKLRECKNAPANQIIITIVTGISMQCIQSYLGEDKKIVRVMPNTPLLIGEGASALARTDNVTDAEFKVVLDIFEKMGIAVVIDESQMETIIPANGSSPAFVYYFIKALADTCEHMGVDRDVAIKLLCQTFIGSAKMVLETGESLEQLITNVCSPKGATLEAIKVYDDLDLSGIIEKGAINCVNRARELGKN